jgi:cysteine desulfurase / selenocysteine lyase
VFASHPDEGRNVEILERLRDAGIHVAVRAGALRFSPHLYNAPDDIDRALEALDSLQT